MLFCFVCVLVDSLALPVAVLFFFSLSVVSYHTTHYISQVVFLLSSTIVLCWCFFFFSLSLFCGSRAVLTRGAFFFLAQYE